MNDVTARRNRLALAAAAALALSAAEAMAQSCPQGFTPARRRDCSTTTADCWKHENGRLIVRPSVTTGAFTILATPWSDSACKTVLQPLDPKPVAPEVTWDLPGAPSIVGVDLSTGRIGCSSQSRDQLFVMVLNETDKKDRCRVVATAGERRAVSDLVTVPANGAALARLRWTGPAPRLVLECQQRVHPPRLDDKPTYSR